MRKLSFALTTLAALIGCSCIGNAGTITYAIQNYPDDQDGANLTGVITTDGTIGDLAASDILSWSWAITFTDGYQAAYASTDFEAGIAIIGSIVASPNDITIGEGENVFELVANGGPPDGFLAYSQYIYGYYAGGDTTEYWENLNATLGGNEPWVIAVAVSSVPEPSSIALTGFAAAFGLVLRSARKHKFRLK